jgi:lysozyme
MIFTVSSKGIALIKESEGWRDKVYKDTGGRPTIGYGHLLVKGDIFKQITREQGEALLAKDVSKAEIIVHRHVCLFCLQFG